MPLHNNRFHDFRTARNARRSARLTRAQLRGTYKTQVNENPTEKTAGSEAQRVRAGGPITGSGVWSPYPPT